VEPQTDTRRHALDVRELVLVALLAAVGGVLSTYVGYIGNLINRLFGVPFGAGQLIAGLHIVWPLLARSLIPRFGSGTLTGVVKGTIEFLAGGTHGVVVVLVSLIEGVLIDVGMGTTRRPNLWVTMLAGAVASASNVFVFQAIYFSGVSLPFVLLMAGLSFVSGAFFGGYLSWDLRRLLESTRLVSVPERERELARRVRWGRHIVSLVTVGLILGGAVYFFTEVYDPFASPDEATIEGTVEQPTAFRYGEWDGRIVTITAELRGSMSYVAPQAYTGVLLADILEPVRPTVEARSVRVIADDGYEATFALDAVEASDMILLTLDDGRLRLIAAGYDGSYWVRRVTRIVVTE